MYETVVSFIGVNHCKPQENHFLALYIQYVLVYKIIFITLFPETLTLASWCFWDAMMKMKAKVKATQSCPMICNPMDFTVHRIFQVRILEVAISYFRETSQPRDQTWVSRIAGRLFIIWATKEDRMSKMSNLECPKLESFPLPPNLVFSSVQLHCSNGSSILWGILVTNPISNLFYEVIIIPKAKIKQRWQENYKLIPLINLDTKILNEIWVNQVQQYRKRIRGNAQAGAYCRNAGLVQVLQNQLM